MAGTARVDEWKKNKNEPNMRNSLEEFFTLHDRAFVSNFLWDMNVNGFELGTTQFLVPRVGSTNTSFDV